MITKQEPRLLASLKPNQKFEFRDKIYTVYQIEGNMAEVCTNNIFSVWPLWNGKEYIKVTPIIYK